jgi:cell division protein FtsW
MAAMLKKLEKYDLYLLMSACALTCFGVVMVYSASATLAEKRFHDSFYFLKRQGGFAIAGFIIMYAVMQIDYHIWRKLAVPALIASLVLLGAVFIPGLGGSAGGSSRWIKLFYGFRFQPSEMAKIALIVYMAFSLDRKQDKVKSLEKGFLPYMVVLVMMMALLLKQPDLGSAVTLFLVAFAMLFAAGTRVSHIISVILLSLPFFYYLVMNVAYRKRRIMAFLDPWKDPQDTGFQIIQSWLALGTGGLLGRGLGNGIQKMFYLPEAHTDFILAVIGEEFGFLGVLVIIGLFFMLVQRAICIALTAPDSFGRHLAFGIAALFGIESIINMFVVTGMLPTKGLALPFISYGGSSLLVSLFAVGILLNISARLNIPSSMLKKRA